MSSDPENLLIFGPGCLVGTMAPGANRVSIETKNAYSGGKGSANFGGHFGPELRFAGFDHVVISGKAERPVYLWIHDGQAEIRDASGVWGRTTYETEAMLHAELGDDRIEVAAIGPAGENLVRGACVVGDLSKVAGGSGVGCVMGSKNLKALAVRGHGLIRPADGAKVHARGGRLPRPLRRFPPGPELAQWDHRGRGVPRKPLLGDRGGDHAQRQRRVLAYGETAHDWSARTAGCPHSSGGLSAASTARPGACPTSR